MSRFVRSIQAAFRYLDRRSSTPRIIRSASTPTPELGWMTITPSMTASEFPRFRARWTTRELSQLYDHAAKYSGTPDWTYAVRGRSACQCRRAWSRYGSDNLERSLDAVANAKPVTKEVYKVKQ